MLEFFLRKLEPFIAPVFDALIIWFLRLRWRAKLAAISLTALAAGTIYLPEGTTGSALTRLYYIQKVMLSWDGLPLSSDTVKGVSSAKQIFVASIVDDLAQIGSETSDVTAWAAAQELLAIDGIRTAVDSERTIGFVYASRSGVCACWTEVPSHSDSLQLAHISGWVFAALGAFSKKADPEFVSYLLDQQNEDGWWTTFPVNANRDYASTYATAWAIIGLISQKNSGAIDGERDARIDAALKRASLWLRSVSNGRGRWKTYPYLEEESDNPESDSVSGLIVHALNLSMPSNVEDINLQWLESLSNESLKNDREYFHVEIKIPGEADTAIDHFLQLKIPWMVIATVDAFYTGDIFQRSRAAEWLERALSDHRLLKDYERERGWWKAEALYALNYAAKGN